MRRPWFILLAALLAGILLSGMGKAPTAEEVPRITADELKAELGSPGLIVIDVRRDKDWKASDRKVVGAAREDASALQKWAGKYSKEKKIVLYCA
jgi:rhodanese-related sulfurtransferase